MADPTSVKCQVSWSVVEHVNGPGLHDDGVRDGDQRTLASGSVVKEGEPEELRRQLTIALEAAFPRHALGPTYDLDRVYKIEIEAIDG